MSRLLAQINDPNVNSYGWFGGGPPNSGSTLPTDESILGTVSPPPGVAAYNAQAGGGIGILLFISTLIRVGTVVAGLWVLFNFITAGFDYITSGDGKAHQKVKDKLTTSVIGLVIIVAAHVVIAILGLILFGDAAFFLNPKICGPGETC